MALFRTPQEHADNPPSTWVVAKKADRVWAIRLADGTEINSFSTRKEALERIAKGFYPDLYEKERRWFAGEKVRGWRSYNDEYGKRNERG